MIKKYFAIVSLLVSLLVPSILLARDSVLRSVRHPIGAQLSWVGKNIRQNGLILDIQSFRSHKSVLNVLDFYRQIWTNHSTSNQPGYLQQTMGEWSVVSTLSHGHSITLQVKQTFKGGSVGYLSALDTTQPTPENPRMVDLPLPQGTKLLSSTHALDAVKHGVTLIAVNSKSVTENYRFFRTQMQFRGWGLATHNLRSSTAVLIFEKANTYCEVSINKAEPGSTVLFLNRVKNGA